MPKAIDITNNVYGYLKALSKEATIKRQTRWRCVCVCGNEVVVETRNLQGGLTKSCGCKSNEMRSQKSTTHGMSKLPI